MRDLAPDRKLALINIYDGNGFQALLDVIENNVLDAEDALIGEPPGSADIVLALHANAHAHRALLTKVTQQIDVMVADARQSEKKDTMARREVKPLD